MKTKLYIVALLSMVSMIVTAQEFTPNRVDNPAIKSQQLMSTGASYSSTVYAPFSTTTPAESNPVSGTPTTTTSSGPRRGFDIGGDTPTGPSPIGDAVLPMLVFALIFCGGIALRRKRVA